MIDAMNLAILVGAGLVAVSAFTSLLSFRVGAPLLLVFLLVGLVAGEDGPGGIHFDNGPVAYFVGSLALAIILFDSGFETRLRSYRIAAAPALLLATVGVLLTAGLVGLLARPLLGLGWVESLLLGAIVGSTDAAAVFFLLRVGGVTLRERVAATLEVESGTNDPMAVFLTVTLVELAMAAGGTPALSLAMLTGFLQQMGLGLVCGLAGGFALGGLLGRLRLDPSLSPVVAISLALVLFAAVGLIGGSGFLAVYLAGLVAGNLSLKSAPRLRRFQAGMTWLAQIGMFVTLGLLATPSQFPAVAGPALALALFLILVARPLAVALCLVPLGFSRNEVLFVGWVGLRGAVSILLAIVPALAGMPDAPTFFNAVFIMVLISLLLQGWTVRPLARRLGLVVPPRLGPVDRVELDLPGDAAHELVAYGVRAGSPVVRGERVPRWARPSLILREGRALTVHNAGALQVGDRVYLFADPRQVPLLDRLFAGTVADGDEHAFFGDFPISPDSPLGPLASSYGFAVEAADTDLSVGAFCQRELGGLPAVGDRVPVGPMELVVRSLGPKGEVREVGLALEPIPEPSPWAAPARRLAALVARLRALRPGTG